MSKVAIITARGGSKRIPRKNIKEFCGRPIIAYSIKAALESDLFDEVMVSTDDEEIADVSRAYGASVPFMRSASASDEHVPVLRKFAERYSSSSLTVIWKGVFSIVNPPIGERWQRIYYYTCSNIYRLYYT